MMHHYTMVCKRFRSSGDMEQTVIFVTISAHTVTLILKIGTQSFITKGSVVQKILIVRTNILWGFESSLWPGPSGQQFSHNTPTRDECTTIPSLVATVLELQEVYIFWGYVSTLWPWCWRGTQTFHMTIKPTWQISLRKVKWFRRYRPDNIPWGFKPSLWPWSWGQPSQNSHTTPQLVVMHHYTTFGCKRFRSSGDMEETVILGGFEPTLWPWPWRQELNLFTWHSGSWLCTIIPRLVAYSSVVQKTKDRRTHGQKESYAAFRQISMTLARIRSRSKLRSSSWLCSIQSSQQVAGYAVRSKSNQITLKQRAVMQNAINKSQHRMDNALLV